MKITAWTGSKLREGLTLGELPKALAAAQGTVWIDIVDPSTDQLEKLADILQLHELVVEDILARNQRARISVHDDFVHLVMFTLTLAKKHLRDREIDLVLGRRFLLSVHPSDWHPEKAHQLRDGLELAFSKGPDYLLWALVDSLVDSYFPLFDKIDERINDLEDRIVARADRATVNDIFQLKRDLVSIRHATSPQREIFNQLTNRDLPFIQRHHLVYFRDVYDHLIRLTDELEGYRDRLTGALDAYLSTINNNLAEIAKRLTAVTVILATIGAIGGIFGMSEAGPALAGQEMVGFWIITVASVVFGVGMIFYLRRIDWL